MEWQPIETAPKDGTTVLGYSEFIASDWNSDAAIASIQWYDYGNEVFGWYGSGPSGLVLTSASHWMPLPAPPDRPIG